MNRAFPEWKSASHVLTEAIDYSFGPIIEQETSNLTIHLLPAALMETVIPEKHRLKYNCLYTAYINWMESKGAFRGVSRFQYEMITSETISTLRYLLNMNFSNIEMETKFRPQDILKGVMGIDPYCFRLPPELREIYERENAYLEMDRSDFYTQPFKRLV